MCGACSIADLALVSAARRAADELLGEHLHVQLGKGFNLSSPKGFDKAVASLAALLGGQAKRSDDAAVRAAVAALDVNWGSTAPGQRSALIARALEASGRSTAALPRTLSVTFGDAAKEVVAATRDSARQAQGLHIGADFNALDRRIVQHLATSQANFIRDEYGRRHAAFSEQARQIVSSGLERGLGRADLARELEVAARDVIGGRGSFYWETVAGAFVANGRSYAQLSAYAEAGIDRYIIEAVLDERTTEICRFLDGKTFSVSRGLELFDRVEANPDGIEELNPWVRDTVDPATGRRSLTVERGGERISIADIVRSGVGARDDRGEFSRGMGERELGDLGIGFPPYHGLCRTTTVAELE